MSNFKPCRNPHCRDGWVLSYAGTSGEGWDQCGGCHGTTFALPLFPTSEQIAAAEAERVRRRQQERGIALPILTMGAAAGLAAGAVLTALINGIAIVQTTNWPGAW